MGIRSLSQSLDINLHSHLLPLLVLFTIKVQRVGLVAHVIGWVGAIKDIVRGNINQKDSAVVSEVGQKSRNLHVELLCREKIVS